MHSDDSLNKRTDVSLPSYAPRVRNALLRTAFSNRKKIVGGFLKYEKLYENPLDNITHRHESLSDNWMRRKLPQTTTGLRPHKANTWDDESKQS